MSAPGRKTNFASVEEYIASQAESAHVLERVRSAIRKAVPDAEEAIAYNIPTYKLHGDVVLHFAGWKRHYSLYPANERVVAAFGDALAPYAVEKGTLRFSLSEPVPAELISRIATFRAREVNESATSHARKRKTR